MKELIFCVGPNKLSLRNRSKDEGLGLSSVKNKIKLGEEQKRLREQEGGSRKSNVIPRSFMNTIVVYLEEYTEKERKGEEKVEHCVNI